MRLGHAVREGLYAVMPKPTARRACDFRGGTNVRRILLLSKPGNPSFSYYLEDRLSELSIPVEICSLDAKLDEFEPRGTFVIICRYVKPRQLLWLRQHHRDLAGIGLFVDDDISSMVVAKDGPLDYRAYLFGMGVLPLFVLNGLLTHLWVSTEALSKAFVGDGLAASVLAPRPGKSQYRSIGVQSADGLVRMVFHATGAHFSEHQFLMPIVADMLARHAHLSFDVIAEDTPARWWRNLAVDPDRMRIRSPLPWRDYFRETASNPADIALVPLLPGRTNDRRSDTKRIDVSRLQAAAIYSNGEVYRRCAMPDEVFADHKPAAWRQEIDRLANDPLHRQRVREATMASMTVMREASHVSFPGLDLVRHEASHAE